MDWDLALFRAINGLSGRDAAFDAVVIFCATWILIVMFALALSYVVVAWKIAAFEGRVEDAAHVTLTLALALLIDRFIGFVWFRLRPFAAHDDVIKLVDRLATDKSFPSSHAAAAFALAFGLLMHDRRWGWAMLALAVLVGFGRVAAGVHYPTDVLSGAIVGGLAALATRPVKRALEPLLDWFPAFGKNPKW